VSGGDRRPVLLDEAAAFAALADPYEYRKYIAGALPDPPASPLVPAYPSGAAARDPSPGAAREVSPDAGPARHVASAAGRYGATDRTLPAVPDWVQDPAKWVTLSRADRRALERHHRKQQRQ
jgi:hypothetical protein